MKPTLKHRRAQQGAGLIEVLVTLVILMLGLLGLVGLMVTSQRSQVESYQRVQALVVAQDMINRINANRKVAECYVVTTTTSGTPYLGKGSSVAPACTVGTTEQKNQAIADMTQWNRLLLGASESIDGSNAGTMLDARGCVEQVSAGVYRVSVVWQGNSRTFAPPAEVACGKDLYGHETQRRAVSMPVKIANLS